MKKLFFPLLLAIPVMAVAQPVNLDFEEWVNPVQEDINRPSGWLWSSGLYTDPLHPFFSPPATNAYSGSYALTMNVWYNYVKDMAIQYSAFTQRPERFTGHYTYVENAIIGPGNSTLDDIARVSVLLTRWNSATFQRDTIGFGSLDLDGAESYTAFEVVLNYQSQENPDSLTLTLDPSLVKRFPDTYFEAPDDGLSSYFTVDGLSFVGGSLGIAESTTPLIRAYPNPATDIVYFGDFSGTVTLRDASGKIVFSGGSVQQGTGISLAGIPPGMYFPELFIKETVFHSNPIIKQ